MQPEASSLVQLSADSCAGASRAYLIASIAIAAVAALGALFLKLVLDKRHKLTAGARIWLSGAFAFFVSTAVLSFEPIRSEALMACRESAEFSRYVFLANVSTVPRALVLGGCVSIVLFLVSVVVANLVAKPKG